MISQGYKDLLLELRSKAPGWGTSAWKHAEDVIAFAEKVGAKSILDYGAGSQSLSKFVELDYYAYDPVVPGIDKRPIPKCDIVVALDVLEHVEPIYTQAVLGDIWAHARLGVYLHIPVTRARKVLPDGRNAHINLKTPLEWCQLIDDLPTKTVLTECTDTYVKISAMMVDIDG